MTWSFPIGRLFGSELRIHATFFLLLAFVALGAYSEGGMQAALWNVLFVLALFACVVAHEFGHALTARRYGIKTPDITLLPIGGMARMERMPDVPRHEILVALAGPAVNVVIWAVLSVAFGAPTDVEALTAVGGGPTVFLGQLAAVNLFLALFNLIPAFPMDGGRVLRAVLAMNTDRVRATRAAANAGQIVAFGLGLWGLSTGNVILILIAIFVFFAGQMEANDVAAHAVARGMKARDAMITSFESLRPEDTMNVAAQVLIRTTQHEFPVLDADGRLAGFLTRTTLFRAIAEGNGAHPVSEAMEHVPSVLLGSPLEDALTALNSAPAVAVTARQGQVMGYITPENVGELMVVRRVG